MISLFSRKKNVREDGEVTRRHILETAVRLFAEHGYADTTSKMICKEAGVNIAAVNYHFGSRDDLYRAVLEDVHEHIVNEREMEAIMNADCSAEERLGMVLDAYIANIYNSQSWHSRIWAHELIAPSTLGGLSFLQGTLTKERSIYMLLVPVCWQFIGFYFVVYLTAIANIPGDIYESAVLDGVKPLQKAIYITVPMLKSTLTANIVLVVSGCFRVFDMVYVITGGGPMNSSQLLSSYMYYKAFADYNTGYASALAIIMMALGLTITGIMKSLTNKISSDD